MLISILLALILVSALLAILADWGKRGPAFFVFKPLTSVLVIALALAWPDSQAAPYPALILGGLAFCLLGDVLLMGEGTRPFIAGLLAFLVGHLAFAAAFVLGVDQLMPPDWSWLLVLAGVPMFGLLIWRADGLRVPVAVYGAVLLCMLLLAAARHQELGDAAALRALLGALLFVLSDSLLAIRKFLQPRIDLQPPLLLSYWAGIALIGISA